MIAIAHSKSEMNLPTADDVLGLHDSILVAGPKDAIDQFEELMNSK